MGKVTRTISRSEYLQALALYTMACNRQAEAEQFNIEMNKLLGLDAPNFNSSRISDGIYSIPKEPFDLVLSYEGIEIETTPVTNGNDQ